MQNDEIISKLEEIRQLTLLNTKKALTLSETALLTSLSKSHIYKMCMLKKIPYFKPNGKLTYFDKDEITAWMLQNRISTSAEIEAKAINYVVTGKKGGKKWKE